MDNPLGISKGDIDNLRPSIETLNKKAKEKETVIASRNVLLEHSILELLPS